jgi:hypothetical protein
MGLYAVEVEGKYGSKGKTNANVICVLLEAMSEKDAVRQAQNIFLKKFPDDYIQEFSSIKITLDATILFSSNPSARNPVELKDNATNSN